MKNLILGALIMSVSPMLLAQTIGPRKLPNDMDKIPVDREIKKPEVGSKDVSLQNIRKEMIIGDGTRGGGQVVDVDSTPYLLDLVTRAICDWKDGAELIAENKSLRLTLERLEKIDWYFSGDFKKEVESISFCMTGPLYRHREPIDPDSPILPERNNTRQAAFRLNHQAFIDTEIFEKMNEGNQAMLIIHETMHSYLNMRTVDRALKLRSMVKLLDDVRTGKTVTRAKLHSGIRNNEIRFPTTVNQIQGKKEVIEFLLDDIDTQITKILKTPRPEILLELDSSILPLLAPWDARYIRARGVKSIFEEALLQTLISSQGGDFAFMIDGKEFTNYDPARIALANIDLLNPEQKRILFNSLRYGRILSDGLLEVAEAQVIYSDYLLLASIELQELTAKAENDFVPLVRLSPSAVLPAKLAWLPRMMVLVHAQGELSTIVSNEGFYRALGLKNQKEFVAQTANRFPREKEAALVRLDVISKSLVAALMQEIARRTDARTYEAIKKQIKFDQF